MKHKTDLFEWYAYVDMCRQLIQKIRSIDGKESNVVESDAMNFEKVKEIIHSEIGSA